MDYKDSALKSLSGKWGLCALMTLAFFIISAVPALLIDELIPMPETHHGNFSWGDLWQIPMIPLAWGMEVVFLSIAQNEKVRFRNLFDGFQQYGRIFWTEALRALFVGLWLLLLIIPGIIKYYSYSMTYFILKDTDLGYDAAIDYSSELMDGHKGELFLLDLSFVGWFILSIMTVGIGFLFSYPYWMTARAHFYEHLKESIDVN